MQARGFLRNWAMVLVLGFAATAAVAEAPEPPPYYAIQNVRIVTAPGSEIEAGTVLVADGLIEAVGTGVAVPADAWVVDGEGLTLYPGMIEALSAIGLKKDQEEAEEASGPPEGGGPQIRGPEDRPKTTPWISAADELGEDSKIEKWREAGFTAVVTAPDSGIFAGQAAVIHLGDSEARERVLDSGTAHRINFEQGGFLSFPGSLMGVLSYIEQVFSDTRHYAKAKALYQTSPLGRDRPIYDRTLEALEEAATAEVPFLLPANLAREIDRALRMQANNDLAAILYGGQGAYARIDAIADSGAAVLVSLNWPKEESDRDPEADTPFRTLYHRRMAPTTPAALAARDVPFGFYSDGLAGPKQIFENVRTAIEAGLSEEAALRALTLGPAQIFGVADRMGTIERGKIANLVLASGPPWAEDTEVKAVFIDGRKYEMREEEEEGDPPASDVTGTWEITLQTPGGPQEMTAEVEMTEDGEVTGNIVGRGTTPIDDGKMSGDLLRFKTTREMGGQSITGAWSLTVTEDSVSGAMTAMGMAMDVSGSRTAAPAVADTDEDEADDAEAADKVSLAELQEVMDVYQNPVRRLGSFAITNATVFTVSGETIENGTIVVGDGKIRAVGRGISVPSGAEVFDAQGGSVIPGIIDAHSHIAIDGGGNEASVTVSSMVSIGDVLNPDDINIYRALAGGVTTANILHGSANPIGGRNAVIKLRWGSDAEGLKIADAMPGIKFALGENPKRSNFRGFGIPQRYPQTRMGVMDVIRQAFTEAKEYQRTWREYEARSKVGRPTPPRRDFRLEALVEILEGERLVHSHCYRADEIVQLLRLAEEFGFQIATLQHVLEGYKVADEIAAHGAGASTFSDWWGYKVEAYDAIPHNAALMAERGVLVSINSDSGEEMRHLNQEVAKTVKWGGMDEIGALKLITLNPAMQFGIDNRVGSIEVGKDADLVIYDGHPLAVTSVVQRTFVDGDLYFDIEADRERTARVAAIKERLMPADEEDGGDAGEETEAGDESEPSPAVTWQDEVYTCREEG